MIGRQIPLEFVFQTLIIRTLMKKGYQSILNIFSGTNSKGGMDYGQWMFKAYDGQNKHAIIPTTQGWWTSHIW